MTKRVLLFIILISFLGVTPGYSVCTEQGNYLVCEDFDSGDPGDFPFTKNSWYHEAHVGNYGNPENNRITSEIAHSGNRCLKMEKVTTSESGGDIHFSFPNQDEMFVRWYWYFPEGFAKRNKNGHLFFVNTAFHGFLRIDNLSNYLVDHNTGRFWNHTFDEDRKHYIAVGGFESSDEEYCWTCENSWGSGKWTSGDLAKPLYYKHNDYDNAYWRIADNEGRWICFEFYANNINHTTKLWIDGELWLESDPSMFTWQAQGWSGFNTIIFSNYRHDSSSPNILYIDDVVVSTSYIGPRGGGLPNEDSISPTTSDPSPAKNSSNVPQDTNISVHVQDSGDGVDQNSIVMNVNGEDVSPSISGDPSDYVLVYDPPSDFGPGQTVSVTIDAQDLHVPANEMHESYSFTIASQSNISPTINSFTGVPSSLDNPGESTTFNVSATDPDSDPLTYMINFGDGTTNGNGSHIVHKYMEASQDPFTATATVNDGHGHSVSETIHVTVDNIPPVKPTNVSSN